MERGQKSGRWRLRGVGKWDARNQDLGAGTGIAQGQGLSVGVGHHSDKNLPSGGRRKGDQLPASLCPGSMMRDLTLEILLSLKLKRTSFSSDQDPHTNRG